MPLLARLEVGADRRQEDAEEDHREGLEDRPARQHDREDEAHHHEREILRWAEDEREPGQRGAECGDDERRDRAGEERADCGDAERDARAALASHLVAVERRDDRGRFAGDVDQDRRRRAAVLRAVIDAGEHDQGADRVETEGDRQQHRDGRDRADTGQHADQGADEAAEEGEAKVLQCQSDRKPSVEIAEEIAHQILPE